jgi:NAD(P)-dependent dehydrogenase (short-subunit alcohol dehydrogenase family)
VWGIDKTPIGNTSTSSGDARARTRSDPFPTAPEPDGTDPDAARPDSFCASPNYHFIQADITDREALVAAAERVQAEIVTEQREKAEPGLDAIVNMAGIYDLYSLAEIEESRFMHDFDVNLFGMYRVNQLFLPLLRPRGRIIIISSELAPLDPLPFTGIYALTKTAVEKYACALRMELQLLGHPVVVVRPGAVATDLLPVSVTRLNDFCDSTQLYPLPSDRFRRIVNRVESRSIPPERLASRVVRALNARRPRLVYNINRNPLLRLLDFLPARLRLFIIKRILS